MITDWKSEIAVAYRVQQYLEECDHNKIFEYHLPRVKATEDSLCAVEAILGHSLDARYRQFLSYADGWPDFYQTVDLFGTKELRGNGAMNLALDIITSTDEVVWSDLGLQATGILPIAVAKHDRDLFVIMRPGYSRAGQVLWLAGAPVEWFPDFDEFFLTMVDYNRVAIDQFKRGFL